MSRARPAEPVHRAGGDDQGMGGVQPAGHADHDLGLSDRPKPLFKTGHLNVVGLVAVLGEARRVGRYERKAGQRPSQTEVAVGGFEVEGHRPVLAGALGVGAAVVVEGALPEPVLHQRSEVEIGDRGPWSLREPLRRCQQRSVVVDQRLTVPGQVSGGFALTRGRVDVAGQQPGRTGRAEQLAFLRLGHGDRAPGQVRDHRRTGKGCFGGRGDRDPHVLADLYVQHESRHVFGGEQQVGPEGHVLARHPDLAGHVISGSRSAAARRTRGRWAGSDLGTTPSTIPRWITTAQL